MAATMTIALVPVEWWEWDDADPGETRFRHCQWCGVSACEDAMGDRPFRGFHQQRGGAHDGACVGDCCLEEFLSEPME